MVWGYLVCQQKKNVEYGYSEPNGKSSGWIRDHWDLCLSLKTPLKVRPRERTLGHKWVSASGVQREVIQNHIRNVFPTLMRAECSEGSVTALNTVSARPFLRGSAYWWEGVWARTELGLMHASFNYYAEWRYIFGHYLKTIYLFQKLLFFTIATSLCPWGLNKNFYLGLIFTEMIYIAKIGEWKQKKTSSLLIQAKELKSGINLPTFIGCFVGGASGRLCRQDVQREGRAAGCRHVNVRLELPALASRSKWISPVSAVTVITEKFPNFSFPFYSKEWSPKFTMYFIVTHFTFPRVFGLTCFCSPSWPPLLSFADGVCVSSPSACVVCGVGVTAWCAG